jgi:hypothetical protein
VSGLRGPCRSGQLGHLLRRRVLVEVELGEAARIKAERKARSTVQRWPCGVVLRLHRPKKPSDKPPHERATDCRMRNSLPKQAIEKPREVAHEEDEPNVPEKDKEEAHDKRQLIRKPAGRHLKNPVKPKEKSPRPSDLTRALRWLKTQHQRRAEETARGDRADQEIKREEA